MDAGKSKWQAHGFTLVELLVVIAIIGLLAALLLPALSGGQARAKRIVCENQLQQIGIAFQSFAHDHNSKFPMQVPVADGGSQEFVQSGDLLNGVFYFGFRHFQTLSGILQTPPVLVCPADTRFPARDFASLQNSNISYFVGVTADYNQPMSILAGDGNLASSSTLVNRGVGGRLTWNRNLHQYKGNVLFADGHVEEWSDGGPFTLGSSSDLVLPSVGGNGNDGGMGAQPAGAFPAASPVSGTNNSHSSTPAGAEAGQGSPAANPMATGTGAGIAATAGHLAIPGTAGSRSLETSNPAPEMAVTAATNSPGAKVSSPGDDDNSTMSPFNRHLVRLLRQIIGGTYLLLLLLLLLFIAYRIWRWTQDPERRRRLPGRGGFRWWW